MRLPFWMTLEGYCPFDMIKEYSLPGNASLLLCPQIHRVEVGEKIEDPNWNSRPESEGSVQGALWGEGDGTAWKWGKHKTWLLLEVRQSVLLQNMGWVKSPEGLVVAKGSLFRITQKLHEFKPEAVIIGITLSGGDGWTLTGGDRSTLIAGNYATLTGGHHSTLTAKDRSTLKAGRMSIITAGSESFLIGGRHSILTGGSHSTFVGGFNSTFEVHFMHNPCQGTGYFGDLRYRREVAYVGETVDVDGDVIGCDLPYTWCDGWSKVSLEP